MARRRILIGFLAALAIAASAVPGAAGTSGPPYGGGVCANNLAPDSLNQFLPVFGTATATGTSSPADGRMSMHVVAQDQAPAGFWLPYTWIPPQTINQWPLQPVTAGPYYIWGVGATTAFELCRISHAESGLAAGTRTVSVSLDQISGLLSGGAAARATGAGLHPLIADAFARVDARLRIEYYPCGTCGATAVTETPLQNLAHSHLSGGVPAATKTLSGSINVPSSAGTVVVHVDVQGEGWVRGSWRAEVKTSLRVAQISIT